MPTVYLSPSVQTWNPCILGDSEAIHMNHVADAMAPLFPINGISYRRDNLSMTLAQIVADSNRLPVDLHFALHSNASPEATAGRARGSRYYYYTNSVRGRTAAQDFAANIKNIYPLPDRVNIFPTSGLYELNRTTAPAVIAETAFHDNLDDAEWLHQNIQAIAQNYMQSICRYFGKQTYIPPCVTGSVKGNNFTYAGLAYGTVCTENANLNVRTSPSGTVMFSLPKDTQVIVLSDSVNGFIKIRHNSAEGYVSDKYLCVCNTPSLPFSALTGTVNTASGNLNLRAGPATTFPVTGSLPRGGQLVIIGSGGGFYQVNYNGITGYASANYININES
ncbi:MAG: SH3 domain-containing protein [Clostridiales bacterium]|jgi:N-acetylmuramoyl-L-alanine amidase|nr:SH3 domain-containing protein [Clostridiales bacterium]